ncbi:MAG: hypothetical protein WC870_02320 [Candidatus Paceibacterota bacterium]
MDEFKLEKNSINLAKKITPEKRNEYILIAMDWSQKMLAGEEKEALLLKKELLRIEQELSMTPEQIMNSKPK